MYSILYVQYTLCTVPFMYSTLYVQYTLCTVHFMYSTLYVQYTLCTVPFMYSTLYAQYPLCTVPFMYSTLYVVCFLLGNSPASEYYMPTFRNALFHIHRQVDACRRWNRVFRNVGI